MKFLLWFTPMFIGIIACSFGFLASKGTFEAQAGGILLMAIGGLLYYGTHRQRK